MPQTTRAECPICDTKWDEGCRRCGWQPQSDRGFDTEQSHTHPLAPVAQTLATDVCPIEPGFDGFGPLRRLTSETETRLGEAGYNSRRRGVEVVNVSEWQSKHRAVGQKRLFEFLLRDSVETHLWFYTAYHGLNSFEALREQATGSAETSYGSEARLLKSYDWLRDIDAPTTLETSPDVFERETTASNTDVSVDAENTDQSSLTGF